jgi:mannitol-1-phosphate 5-dehydrogenase
MKAIHFGAGNIGRGFIGLLLSRAGYEVIFVDVNETVVSLLQERGEYFVSLANESQETTRVTGVTAISGRNIEQAAEAIARADLVTTAVGVNILKHIAEGIARGIEMRITRNNAPLHVIACENAIGGSSQLKEHVYAHLSEENRLKADEQVAFPDAAVDRIVPIQHHDDPLHVTVEPFYEWVVDRSAMIKGFKEIEGVHYVDKLEPYIERKLFTVNTGHCCAAYLGYLKGYSTIQQTMKDSLITSKVEKVLEETGALLVNKYGFDARKHKQYILTILERFRNPYLTDEVVRVGRSPIRKLSPNDRLVRPSLQAFERGIEPQNLAMAMAAALRFDVEEDPEAVELQESIRSHGVSDTAAKYTGIAAGHPIHALIIEQYDHMNQRIQS